MNKHAIGVCLLLTAFPTASAVGGDVVRADERDVVHVGESDFIRVGVGDSISQGNFSDRCIFLADGGRISHTTLRDETVALLRDSDVAHLKAHGKARLIAENTGVSHLHLHDQAEADLRGGDYSHINAHDESSVRIRNMDDVSWLNLEGDASRATIFVSDASYSEGHLKGTWEDGREFKFWLLRRDDSGPPDPEALREARSTLPSGVTIVRASSE